MINCFSLLRRQISGQRPLLEYGSCIFKPFIRKEFQFFRDSVDKIPRLIPFLPVFYGLKEIMSDQINMNEEDLELPTSKTLLKRHKSLSGQIFFTLKADVRRFGKFKHPKIQLFRRDVCSIINKIKNVLFSQIFTAFLLGCLWCVALLIEIEVISLLFQNSPWPFGDVAAFNDFFGFITLFHVLDGSKYFMYFPFLGVSIFIVAMYIASITLAYITKVESYMNLSVKASVRYVILSLCWLLCIPIMSVLCAPLQCKADKTLYFYPSIQCFKGFHVVVFVFAILIITLYAIHVLFVATFTFSVKMKHKGIFACRNGMFLSFLMAIILIFSCVSFIGHEYPIYQMIVGLVGFCFLTVLAVVHQPFYSRLGNATVAVLCVIPAIISIFGFIAIATGHTALPPSIPIVEVTPSSQNWRGYLNIQMNYQQLTQLKTISLNQLSQTIGQANQYNDIIQSLHSTFIEYDYPKHFNSTSHTSSLSPYLINQSKYSISNVFIDPGDPYSDISTGVSVVFWIFFIIAVIFASILVAWMSVKRGMRMWAVGGTKDTMLVLPEVPGGAFAQSAAATIMNQSGVASQIYNPNDKRAPFRRIKLRKLRHIEPATRFLQVKKLRRKPEYIACADAMYQYYTRKFRDEPDVFVSYAIYLYSYANNLNRYVLNENKQLDDFSNQSQYSKQNQAYGSRQFEQQNSNFLQINENLTNNYNSAEGNMIVTTLETNSSSTSSINTMANSLYSSQRLQRALDQLKTAKSKFPFMMNKWIIYSQSRELQQELKNLGLATTGSQMGTKVLPVVKQESNIEEIKDREEKVEKKENEANKQDAKKKGKKSKKNKKDENDQKEDRKQKQKHKANLDLNGQETETKQRIHTAKQLYDASVAFLLHVWMQLSKQNVEVSKVMHFAVRAVEHGNRCQNLLLNLMKEGGGKESAAVMRLFAQLMRDVYRDDEASLIFFEEAGAIEDERAAEEEKLKEEEEELEKQRKKQQKQKVKNDTQKQAVSKKSLKKKAKTQKESDSGSDDPSELSNSNENSELSSSSNSQSSSESENNSHSSRSNKITDRTLSDASSDYDDVVVANGEITLPKHLASKITAQKSDASGEFEDSINEQLSIDKPVKDPFSSDNPIQDPFSVEEGQDINNKQYQDNNQQIQTNDKIRSSKPNQAKTKTQEQNDQKGLKKNNEKKESKVKLEKKEDNKKDKDEKKDEKQDEKQEEKKEDKKTKRHRRSLDMLLHGVQLLKNQEKPFLFRILIIILVSLSTVSLIICMSLISVQAQDEKRSLEVVQDLGRISFYLTSISIQVNDLILFNLQDLVTEELQAQAPSIQTMGFNKQINQQNSYIDIEGQQELNSDTENRNCEINNEQKIVVQENADTLPSIESSSPSWLLDVGALPFINSRELTNQYVKTSATIANTLFESSFNGNPMQLPSWRDHIYMLINARIRIDATLIEGSEAVEALSSSNQLYPNEQEARQLIGSGIVVDPGDGVGLQHSQDRNYIEVFERRVGLLDLVGAIAASAQELVDNQRQSKVETREGSIFILLNTPQAMGEAIKNIISAISIDNEDSQITNLIVTAIMMSIDIVVSICIVIYTINIMSLKVVKSRRIAIFRLACLPKSKVAESFEKSRLVLSGEQQLLDQEVENRIKLGLDGKNKEEEQKQVEPQLNITQDPFVQDQLMMSGTIAEQQESGADFDMNGPTLTIDQEQQGILNPQQQFGFNISNNVQNKINEEPFLNQQTPFYQNNFANGQIAQPFNNQLDNNNLMQNIGGLQNQNQQQFTQAPIQGFQLPPITQQQNQQFNNLNMNFINQQQQQSQLQQQSVLPQSINVAPPISLVTQMKQNNDQIQKTKENENQKDKVKQPEKQQNQVKDQKVQSLQQPIANKLDLEDTQTTEAAQGGIQSFGKKGLKKQKSIIIDPSDPRAKIKQLLVGVVNNPDIDDEVLDRLYRDSQKLSSIIEYKFYILGIIGISLLILGVATITIIMIITVLSFKGYISLALAAEMRGTVAMQLGILVQQLVYNHTTYLNADINVDYATNPTWINIGAQISKKPEVIQSLIIGNLNYFLSLHNLLQYGTEKEDYQPTLDTTIDSLYVPRTKGVYNDLDIFSTNRTQCLLDEQDQCLPGRIAGTIEEFLGLDNIIDMLISASIKLGYENDTSLLIPSNLQFGIIYTLLTWDSRDGIDTYYKMLIGDIKSEVTSSLNLLIAIFVIDVLLTIIVALSLLLPLGGILSNAQNYTTQIERATGIVYRKGESEETDNEELEQTQN